MVALQNGNFRREQCSVVKFLTAEGTPQHKIKCPVAAVYSEHCVSLPSVKCWNKWFKEGCKHYPRVG